MGYRASFMREKLEAEIGFLKSRTVSLVEIIEQARIAVAGVSMATKEEACGMCAVLTLELERLRDEAYTIEHFLKDQYTEAIETSV